MTTRLAGIFVVVALLGGAAVFERNPEPADGTVVRDPVTEAVLPSPIRSWGYMRGERHVVSVSSNSPEVKAVAVKGSSGGSPFIAPHRTAPQPDTKSITSWSEAPKIG